MRVKVHGAGSVGNHLSNAAHQLGWSVDLCDIDAKALARTRNEIYPGRYGAWDDGIRLMESADAPTGGYDFIFIGTPPDTHMDLALAAIEEKPRAVLVEKPLCPPDLRGAQELFEAAARRGVAVFVGYDHVIGAASRKAGELISAGDAGAVETIDVEFREHWGGIFAAHPWLDGPEDTYLGFWKRGGGASGEHSHAINLWQHFAHQAGAGRVTEVNALLDYVSDGAANYDKLCIVGLRTEHGLIGRVVQDVVTAPPRKWVRIQGRDGYIEWRCGIKPGCDAVFLGAGRGETGRHEFEKTRPDDFIEELRHIEASLDGDPDHSPISLRRGLDTMLVVAAVHEAARKKSTIAIDYDAGYVEAALKRG